MGEEWLLSGAEVDKIMDTDAGWHHPPTAARRVALAQLRKLVLESEKPCPHGTQAADTSWAFRRECSQCWESLRKELGRMTEKEERDAEG